MRQRSSYPKPFKAQVVQDACNRVQPSLVLPLRVLAGGRRFENSVIAGRGDLRFASDQCRSRLDVDQFTHRLKQRLSDDGCCEPRMSSGSPNATGSSACYLATHNIEFPSGPSLLDRSITVSPAKSIQGEITVDVRQVERARNKAFYKLLVDRLGADVWAKRRAAFVARIRAKESKIDLKMPIEPQLFVPPEDDIDWYILVAELSHDFPYSDCAYSSTRIYPYTMTIGAFSELIRKVPNVEGVLDKMLANNSKPETQIFELLTASFYLKNGYEVSFIPENSIDWLDGKTKRSPDLLVKDSDIEMYIECKRAGKQTKYSQTEEEAWVSIWSQLSLHMLKVAPWSIVDLTFHDQVSDVTADDVIRVVSLAIKGGGGKIREGSISTEIRGIDRAHLERHYRRNSVRPNSPQQELLVFGDMDSNEKRSIATIAESIVRPGTSDVFLNIFVEDVANCVAAQWWCDHAISLERRSRHFKGLANDGITQIPPDKPGVVHVWYETVEGVSIEEMRRGKNIDNLSAFDASGTSVVGVLIHGVNYYPFEGNYEWAETVQHFARIPHLMRLYPHSLMLSGDKTQEVEDITHWEQDKAAKSTR